MDNWTRRLIGPGPTRDAGPTQPLDDAFLPWDAAADRHDAMRNTTDAERMAFYGDGMRALSEEEMKERDLRNAAGMCNAWLPSDALADAVTQAQLPSEAGHWDHVIAYCVIGAVCLAIGLMTAALMRV